MLLSPVESAKNKKREREIYKVPDLKEIQSITMKMRCWLILSKIKCMLDTGLGLSDILAHEIDKMPSRMEITFS